MKRPIRFRVHKDHGVWVIRCHSCGIAAARAKHAETLGWVPDHLAYHDEYGG